MRGCNALETDGRERESIPYFQSDSRVYTHTYTRDLRTCVAVKPQKLFFLDGVLPLFPRSFQRGRAAGASANAVITPLECTRVATGNAHAFIRIARAGRPADDESGNEPTGGRTVRVLNFENLNFITRYRSLEQQKQLAIFISYIKISEIINIIFPQNCQQCTFFVKEHFIY